MPLFQAAEIRLESGALGNIFQTVNKVQNATINYAPPRQDINVLGNSKPLAQRPVINYTPVNFTVDFIKATKEVETNWGLLNSTGVGVIIGNANPSLVAGYGARTLQLLLIDNATSSYRGQMNVLSGCLNTYSVNASVGNVAKASFAGEGFDLQNITNNTPKILQDTQANLIKPENIYISGIDFSGFGVTGISLQSFNLQINFNRQQIFKLGQRLPDRPVSTVSATLSLQGFIEGITPNATGLSRFNCGNSETGSYYFTLLPACSDLPSTTYQINNPYLDSFNIGASVGSFVSVDLAFSIPISISPSEALTGSNVIIY